MPTQPTGFIGGAIRGGINQTPGLSLMQSIIHGGLSAIPAYRAGGSLWHLLTGTLGQWGNPASNPANNFGQPTATPSPTVQTPGAPDPGAGYIHPPLTPGTVTAPPLGGLNPGQAASDAQTATQTDFQNLQNNSSSPFFRPDEPFPDGVRPLNMLSPLAGQLSSSARAYLAQFPMGSTIPEFSAFNAKVAGGQIPTYQKFAGLPAFQAPTAPTAAPPLLQAFIPKPGTSTQIHA